jgi:alkylhydroperoxidase family enzyme
MIEQKVGVEGRCFQHRPEHRPSEDETGIVHSIPVSSPPLLSTTPGTQSWWTGGMAPRMEPLPLDERDERTQELLRSLRIPSDSGGDELNIFSTFARHPRLLKRWSQFGGTLLNGELDPRDREILILRTAWNCQAEYEWGQHVIIGTQAGLTDDEILACTRPMAEGGWSEDDQALLRAADELHAESRISDRAWELLAGRLTEAQLIEVCMVVGQYHLVAMTLNSLGVEREPGVAGLPH